MAAKEKTVKKIFYGRNSANIINGIMIMLFVVGLIMLVDNSFDEIKPIATITNPEFSAIALGLGVPILSFVVVILSRFDRRCTEDYTFQLMANAALVAVTTLLFFNIITTLDFLRDLTGLRELYGDDLVGITMLSWATAYFIFQRRGLQ
ncbi:MAG: hypothetical protein AAGH53_12210 [Pseudomonadota bacterium]